MQSADKLAARADVYGFLAHAFDATDEGFLRACRSRVIRGAFGVLGLPTLAREWDEMLAYVRTTAAPLELSVERTRLFRGPVKAEAYPYESMYVDGEVMGPSTLDVMRRYQEVGVEVSADFKDLPDHVCAEAEFMRFLCIWELEALRSGETDAASRVRRLRESFLDEHLARWLPQFAARVLQHATTPFYLSLAMITGEFIRRDAATAVEA